MGYANPLLRRWKGGFSRERKPVRNISPIFHVILIPGSCLVLCICVGQSFGTMYCTKTSLLVGEITERGKFRCLIICWLKLAPCASCNPVGTKLSWAIFCHLSYFGRCPSHPPPTPYLPLPLDQRGQDPRVPVWRPSGTRRPDGQQGHDACHGFHRSRGEPPHH